MCELLGVSSARKIHINPYLGKLMSHSTDHPHGWGIATFYGSAVSLEKEAKTALVSDYLRSRLLHKFEVRNMIAHIRLATRGSMSYENCHPFVANDSTGRTWTLAHNGTIFKSEILDSYKDTQEGSTDSERILCHIIHEFSNTNTCLEAEERFALLDRIILQIAKHNKLNLLIYDGEYLYVHTNKLNTLYFTQTEDSAIFATVPLDDDEGVVWEPVPMNQLLAYKNGKLSFCGSKHEFEFQKADLIKKYDYWAGL